MEQSAQQEKADNQAINCIQKNPSTYLYWDCMLLLNKKENGGFT